MTKSGAGSSVNGSPAPRPVPLQTTPITYNLFDYGCNRMVPDPIRDDRRVPLALRAAHPRASAGDGRNGNALRHPEG